MSDQEKLYIKGFNSGYLLAKHMPTLLSKVVKNLNSRDDFSEGLISGKEEFELEYSKAQTDDLSRLRNKSRDLDKGHQRD